MRNFIIIQCGKNCRLVSISKEDSVTINMNDADNITTYCVVAGSSGDTVTCIIDGSTLFENMPYDDYRMMSFVEFSVTNFKGDTVSSGLSFQPALILAKSLSAKYENIGDNFLVFADIEDSFIRVCNVFDNEIVFFTGIARSKGRYNYIEEIRKELGEVSE